MDYSTLTTGIYVRYESLLALDAAALLALVLVGLAVVVVLLTGRFRLQGRDLPEHSRRGPLGGARSARALALAGARLLRLRPRALPRPAARRARLVVGRGRPDQRTRRDRLGRGGQLGARCRQRAAVVGVARRAARRRAGLALPVATVVSAGAAHALPERAPGDRGRTRARLLRRPGRRPPLPELRAAPLRVRRCASCRMRSPRRGPRSTR